MKDGTIVLIEWEPGKLYEKIVIWCIQKVSGKRWTHIGVYHDKNFFEFGHPYGAMYNHVEFHDGPNAEVKPPTRIMTDEEKKRGREFISKHLKENTRYNYWKLIFVFPWMYPTRKFWERIGWIPFQNDFLWGMVCSVGVGQYFDAVGWDCLPGRNSETLTPGDWEESIYH